MKFMECERSGIWSVKSALLILKLKVFIFNKEWKLWETGKKSSLSIKRI